MGELLNLSIYNPSLLNDEDFLRGFVARKDKVHRLIERMATTSLSGPSTHHLLVGQRGMGKTSMLRRLAMAAASDSRLAKVLIPLRFREEQYNVHSLYVFWANCLDALGDYFERQQCTSKAEQLDKEIDALSGEAGESHALFSKWVAAEGRRPLLLLDNIDLVLTGLKRELPALRKCMEEPGGIVIIGGSATSVDEIDDPSGTFHGAFEVIQLDRLTKEELISCLRSLAIARGKDGEKVLGLVDKDPARIRTLHDLTGGNPRTLTLLYMLLEVDSKGDVFGDLERLLDQVTVLYKARVEDLPPQGRVVLDAVALAWNPILAAAVAEVTRLDVSVVSSQLDRLQKEGVIEKVSVSKTTKAAFQISERFFNIWYLMRHGLRRQRSRLKWLTVFLRSFYTDAQLVERAKSLVNAGDELSADSAHLALALSEAISDKDWRSYLKKHARDGYEKYAQSLGLKLEEIVDPSDVPKPDSALQWVRHGDLLRQHLKRPKEAENAFLAALLLEPRNFAAWFNLGTIRLSELADPFGAVEALRNAIREKPKDVMSHYFVGQAFVSMTQGEEAKPYFHTCLRLNGKFYPAAIGLGDILTGEGRLREAEYWYRMAASIAPKRDTENLHASAFFIGYIVEQFDRSIRLYKRLLNIDPTDYIAQSNLAVLQHFSIKETPDFAIDEVAMNRHPPYGKALMLVLQAMRSGDRATAMSNAALVFEVNEEQVFDKYRGFILLFFREAARQGWGDLLLNIMDSTGASDRHWPLRAGYEAYLYGEDRLLDVNPEVRTAASKILMLLKAPARYLEDTRDRSGQ